MKFDRHTVVLLVRPPGAPELSEAEAALVQDAHLAYQASLFDQGHLLAVGPLADQDDSSLRGICILASAPETARQIYNQDPAVRAGRLAVQVMTWMLPAGSLEFLGRRPPSSMVEVQEP